MPTGMMEWTWWAVSVIIVGVAINLFTSFLYPRIEKVWSRRSTARRAKLEAKSQEFQRQVQRLVDRPEMLTQRKLDLIVRYLQLLMLLAVGGMAFFLQQLLLSKPPDSLLGGILALLAFTLLLLAAFGGLGFSNVVLDRITKEGRLIRAAEKALAAAEEAELPSPEEKAEVRSGDA